MILKFELRVKAQLAPWYNNKTLVKRNRISIFKRERGRETGAHIGAIVQDSSPEMRRHALSARDPWSKGSQHRQTMGASSLLSLSCKHLSRIKKNIKKRVNVFMLSIKI